MSSPVSIRVASASDYDGVGVVLRSSYPVLMGQAYDATILDRVLPLITVPQTALLESGTYYVAEAAGGSIVGCGGWTKERPGSAEVLPGLGHVRHFGVHPNWTRQGVGRSIYDRCVEDAKAAGIDRFECYASLNGESFYAALGFQSVGRVELEMPEDVTLPCIGMLAEI
jgi:N-acetylglutamate synthase-like GNAT family acetyltransferase